MEHARRVNQGRGIGSAGSPDRGPGVNEGPEQRLGASNSGTTAPAGPVLPGNRLLAELHAERMARQAQRQAQQAAAPGPGGQQVLPALQQPLERSLQQPPAAQHAQRSPQQLDDGAGEPARCSLLTWNVSFGP